MKKIKDLQAKVDAAQKKVDAAAKVEKEKKEAEGAQIRSNIIPSEDKKE